MNATFAEFDCYAEVIRNVELDVQLLRPHERRWSIQQLEVGQLHVQHAVEGSGLLTRGAVTADGWGLYLQVAGDPIPMNGKGLSHDAVALLPPRSEFCFSGQGKVEWYSLYIPSALIDATCDASGQVPAADVVAIPGDLLRRLTAELLAASSLLEDGVPLDQAIRAQAAIEGRIVSTFIQILDESTQGHSLPNHKTSIDRQRVISTVIELVNDSDDGAYTVPELAETVGVSQRSLLSVFREQLGVSPQEFLISHRLHRARRSLLAASSSDMTVAAVAVQFGFFDLGRFATRYFGLFGESPSATLRRKAR